MRLECARLAVEEFGVEERENVRSELCKTAAVVGKVFVLGVQEAACLICEIANACKKSR